MINLTLQQNSETQEGTLNELGNSLMSFSFCQNIDLELLVFFQNLVKGFISLEFIENSIFFNISFSDFYYSGSSI